MVHNKQESGFIKIQSRHIRLKTKGFTRRSQKRKMVLNECIQKAKKLPWLSQGGMGGTDSGFD